MSIPLIQQFRVGTYLLKNRLQGKRRFPLVLMLEPLFRCNLACAGCGKIDYPEDILNMRLSVDECLGAVDECGAPIVSIPGGEPLIHKEIGEIVAGIVERRKFVYLCTNALLLGKRLDLFNPSPYLTFSIHLDGDQEHHDASVCQEGVYDKVVEVIQEVQKQGFRANINCTLFDGADAKNVSEFFDSVMDMGIDSITVSPGYAYERAPDQEHFLSRQKTKSLFRNIFQMGENAKWRFSHSALYLDFLAGNQTYHCTPWGNPTYNIFGWQKPCYLLGEGYASTFQELMEETDWESYGTGNYEKCSNCMAHCGYESTAVADMFSNPLKALKVSLRGVRTEGPMAPEIPLHSARPAVYDYEEKVKQWSIEVKRREAGKQETASVA